MRKSNLLFIAIIFSFLSCKEKNSEFIFSWKGDFSHEFLELAVDNPEMLSPGVNKETEKSKNSTSSTGLVLSSKPLEDYVFYGIDMKEMGNILKSFGDCKLDFRVSFTVETNGLKIKKIYINEGSELFCNFSSENCLPKIVHDTADIMIINYPVHNLEYGKDDKSFSYYHKYPKPFIIFDSEITGEEIDLSRMDKPKKQKGISFKVKKNKAVITAEDKDMGVFMEMIVEQVK